MDQFCERCGTLQPKPDAATPRSAGRLARRMLDAAGIIETRPEQVEDWLRLCLNCRGYACPNCWNETAGVCQTCEPMPQPVAVVEPLQEPVVVQPAVIEPQPIPYWVTQLEPLVTPRLDEEPEFEPVAVAEPEPESEPVVVAEPEPEPVVEPVPARPVMPRMPVLPLPPPRPADAPVMPLPVPAYPVPPQIAFNAHTSVGASSATAAPPFEAHMLLAPPPPAELSAAALAAGLRPCANCHLTLSARAHFCRRCGTQQQL